MTKSAWFPWLVVLAVVVIGAGLVEGWIAYRWHRHGAPCIGFVRFGPDGRHARFDVGEARWGGAAVHVEWLPDGRVDREASFRRWRGLLNRRLDDDVVRRFESNDWGGRADGYSLGVAIRMFAQLSGGRMPSSVDELRAKLPTRFGGVGIPRDRWGREYRYEPPAEGRLARISTLGRDGTLGGEGDDADWFGELHSNGTPSWSNPVNSLDP